MSGKPTPIDRIDHNGSITEHLTRDGKRTKCGHVIDMTQPVSGNRKCRNCYPSERADRERARENDDALKHQVDGRYLFPERKL